MMMRRDIRKMLDGVAWCGVGGLSTRVSQGLVRPPLIASSTTCS